MERQYNQFKFANIQSCKETNQENCNNGNGMKQCYNFDIVKLPDNLNTTESPTISKQNRPRFIFPPHQLALLEREYLKSSIIPLPRARELAQILETDEFEIYGWFMSRNTLAVKIGSPSVPIWEPGLDSVSNDPSSYVFEMPDLFPKEDVMNNADIGSECVCCANQSDDSRITIICNESHDHNYCLVENSVNEV